MAFRGSGKSEENQGPLRDVAGKRSHCRNEANEVTLRYLDATGRAARCVVRLYNDGLAFRYELDGLQQERIGRELTAYRIEDGTPRWVQRYDGGYENFYTPARRTAREKEGNTRWAYPPCCSRPENTWVLLLRGCDGGQPERLVAWTTERTSASTAWCRTATSCGTTGRGCRPWRVAIVGTLADVVESTLVTDVSPPAASRTRAGSRPAW
jgi:hypothetical protein